MSGEEEWWDEEPYCTVVASDPLYGVTKRYNIPAILKEQRRLVIEEFNQTDKACWYHALTWLLEQEGDIRANAEKHVAELEKDLDL